MLVRFVSVSKQNLPQTNDIEPQIYIDIHIHTYDSYTDLHLSTRIPSPAYPLKPASRLGQGLQQRGAGRHVGQARIAHGREEASGQRPPGLRDARILSEG